jgi:hypothetical protein
MGTHVMGMVFSMWPVPRCCKQGTSLELGQLVCEEKTGRSMWNGYQPGSYLVESPAVKRRLHVWYLVSIILWDCYSYCVKICCQETPSGDCNRLRTLVSVSQWSVKCSHESWVYKWSINPISNPKPFWESLCHVTIRFCFSDITLSFFVWAGGVYMLKPYFMDVKNVNVFTIYISILLLKT